VGAPLLLLTGCAAAFGSVPVALWDLVWVAGAWTFSFLVGASRATWQRLLLAAGALAAGLAGLEIGFRTLLPEPRRYPPASSAHFLFVATNEQEPCRAIDISRRPAWLEARRGGQIREGERVLHLGDSIVFGSGVEGDEAFPAVLEQLDPGYAHVNGGVAGSSLDVQLVVLRTWIDRIKPSRVILHFFTGNDVDEMDEPFPCCDMGPFLSYDGGRITPNCPTPRWRLPKSALIAQSPPPYLLRVATGVSTVARHSLRAFEVASLSLARLWDQRVQSSPRSDSEEQAWSHLELALRTVRDDLASRGIPLTLSVVPSRSGLEAQHPEQSRFWLIRERMIRVAGALGIPVVDPWGFFQDIVAREGGGTVFLPADVHFNAEGHRRYARWLLDRLGPGLRGPVR
jgi:lysophospholipase L1-like esterase